MAYLYPVFGRFVDGIQEEYSFDLADILYEPGWERIRELARDRILYGVKHGSLRPGKRDMKDHLGLEALDDDEVLLESFLSQVISKLIVHTASQDHTILRKIYAQYEAQTCVDILQVRAREDLPLLLEELGIETREERTFSEVVWIHVLDFIRNAPRESEWSLVREMPLDGYLALNHRRAARLLRTPIYDRFLKGLPEMLDASVMEPLIPYCEPIREILAERLSSSHSLGGDYKVEYDEYMPPCVNHILGQMRGGENLPHQMRVFIAAFYNTIGMSPEGIRDLFSTAPDYDEKIVTYQVGQIIDRGYTPHGCDAIALAGSCRKDEDSLCTAMMDDRETGERRRVVVNPLTFFKIRRKRGPRNPPVTEVDGTSDGTTGDTSDVNEPSDGGSVTDDPDDSGDNSD